MPRPASPVGRMIIAAVISLGALLLALPILEAITRFPDRLPLVAVASGLELAALAAGAHPLLVRPDTVARPAASLRWQHALWLALLCLPWSWLIVLVPNASYFGFALYFLALWLLPPVSGSIAAIALAALTAAGQGVHHGWSTGAVVGPVLAASVLVALMIGYRALIAESTERAALIRQLEDAQSALAESQRRAGVLDERARLGRELHDTVAQHLSSIQLLLHAAESGGEDAPRQLAQAREAAADALADTRRFIRDLAPVPLAGSSLATALERLAVRTSERGRVRASFTASGKPRPMPMRAEATLLRIAQEALANVERHARASEAELSLRYEPDAVTLEIADDGAGFDPEPVLAARPSADAGYGIPGMRARAAELGGNAAVIAAPGEGTLVSVRLPIDEVASAAGGGTP